jgi:nicotinate-nucleotide pyrophosphorylase (carboxylating)
MYRDVVRRALDEDIGAGDVTTEATVDPAQQARGVFVAKASCVLAGLDVAAETFRQVDAAVAVARRRLDGERCAPILDTRKTTPTLRQLEKYAVAAGGGTNHRAGLFDAVLIKDNHVRLAGGVSNAVSAARRYRPGLAIEVEAQSLPQVQEAVDSGADVILVDNLGAAEVREAVTLVNGRAKVEISGGVTLDRLSELAATGADYVSIGALTHSAPAVDISFEIEPI